MNEYVLKVLRKSKKVISLEEIIEKVKNRYLKDNPDKTNLSEDDILEIMGIVEDLEKNYEIIRIGDGFKLLRNTSFHKGKFTFDSKGAKVIDDNSYINGIFSFFPNIPFLEEKLKLFFLKIFLSKLLLYGV